MPSERRAKYENAMEVQTTRAIEEEKKKIATRINERRSKYADDYTVLIQSLINTITLEFSRMFPGARAFIEGRIKSNNSIALKLENKFQKAMDKETPEERENAMKGIDLTDILALSVVVTVPPKKFRTTDDKLNERLNELAKGLEKTTNRIKEHSQYIEDNQEQLTKLIEDINELKQKRNDINKNGIPQEAKKKFGDIGLANEEAQNKLYKIIQEIELAGLQEVTDAKNTQQATVEENIKYGQENLSRTTETYDKELLELQREMAYYFVSNLANCQGIRMLNTKQTEAPELKNKPGFVATSTKYQSTYNDRTTGEKYEIIYEVQGKGEKDWKNAEFGKGALYHENQKTDEGQHSKQTQLPDFTIIGRNSTEEIERDVRTEYKKIDFRELVRKIKKEDLEQWFKENRSVDKEVIAGELDKLKKFIKKVQDKQDKPVIVSNNGQKVVVEKDSEEYEKYRDVIEKVADSKINEACDIAKEHVIQAEIEKRIDLRIDKKADEKSHIKDVLDTNNKEVHSVYMKEVERLTALYKAKSSKASEDKDGVEEEKIKHEARVKALYYIKEQEIREITKDIVPIFFLANISDNREDNSMVYYRSTGEAIYRYYYNRLNGLKKGNGYEEKLEPQEQQKKALLKLTGLFEENEEDFFIYDKKKNIRIDLGEAVPPIGEER